MAIQYYMRAYKTTSPTGFVYWISNNTPDTLGTYSGYIPSDLINITVNKTAEFKTENYLKSYNSPDGYFLHLNSYDRLHITPPGPAVPVPTSKIGLAVVRGTATGVTPRDYAILIWDETNQQWKFSYNTNGDGYTIGATSSLAVNNIKFDGYLTTTILPAQSGVLRVSANTTAVSARNTSNAGDLSLLGTDNSDRVLLGGAIVNGHIFNTSTSSIYDIQFNSTSQIQIGNSYIAYGSHPSITGFIRAPNNSIGASARNSGNTTDIPIWSVNSSNIIQLGTSAAGISINGNNISLMSATGSFAGGNGVIFITNAITPPTDVPVNGGVLYVEAGALKYRGSSATVTVLAVA